MYALYFLIEYYVKFLDYFFGQSSLRVSFKVWDAKFVKVMFVIIDSNGKMSDGIISFCLESINLLKQRAIELFTLLLIIVFVFLPMFFLCMLGVLIAF